MAEVECRLKPDPEPCPCGCGVVGRIKRNGHAERWAPAIERFHSLVAIHDDGCWVWTGTTISKGYGRFTNQGTKVLAHRFAYEFYVGPIPSGLQLDHLCRNKRCVRPSHLEPVTGLENMQRRWHGVNSCRWGHPLTLRPTGRRVCYECQRAAGRKYKARKRAERVARGA